MLLIGLILFVISMTIVTKETPDIIAFNANFNEIENIEKPEMKTEVQRKPSSPSSSISKVIAASISSPVSVPVVDTDITEPSLDFGNMDDFGEGWGGSGNGGASGGEASFFNQKVSASRICFVIDYSLSMKGKRDKLMRKELTKSIQSLPNGIEYQMIYFAGPAWVAGDRVELARDEKNKKKWEGSITDSNGKEYRWTGNGPSDWSTRTQRQRVKWQMSNEENIAHSLQHIEDTPLVYGTEWDKPLRMALEMEPAPEIVYFMTDGNSRNADEIASRIGATAKRKGIKINTIAMMIPSAQEAMADLAQRTGGQFSIVNKDGSTEVKVEAEK